MTRFGRKTRKNGRNAGARSEPKIGLEAAAPWPVFESLVSEGWRDTTSLTEILVSKTPPFGGVVSCMFQIDLGCLGPKQGFVSQFRTKEEYDREFRSMVTSRTPMVRAEYPLAAKIIRESLAYSRGLGFEPSQKVLAALSALGSLDAAAECREHIPLGADDGKPIYVAGPDDDAEQIMKILAASCGQGNFHFIAAPQSPIPHDFFD